jgi:hypothetical protein
MVFSVFLFVHLENPLSTPRKIFAFRRCYKKMQIKSRLDLVCVQACVSILRGFFLIDFYFQFKLSFHHLCKFNPEAQAKKILLCA